jgi:hypothetical protein
MIETCQRLWPRCSGSAETGYIQNEIQNAAYEYQRAIEKGERTVVGVNRFQQQDGGAVPAGEYREGLGVGGVRRQIDSFGIAASEGCPYSFCGYIST